jgi:hypothetical protein
MNLIGVGEGLGSLPKLTDGRHPTSTGYVYMRGGLKHRDRGPAETGRDGYEAWFKQGKKHRIGGPAVIYPDGRKEWWEEGNLIRVEGAPEELPPGTKLFMTL